MTASQAPATALLTDSDVEALERTIREGPRPQPEVYRHLGFLRTVYHAAVFAAQHFPPTGACCEPGVGIPVVPQPVLERLLRLAVL